VQEKRTNQPVLKPGYHHLRSIPQKAGGEAAWFKVALQRKRRAVGVSRGSTLELVSDEEFRGSTRALTGDHSRGSTVGLESDEHSGGSTLDASSGGYSGESTPDTRIGSDDFMRTFQDVEEPDLKSLEEAQNQKAWSKREAVMQEEIRSLKKTKSLE
jgi:hypothetical protein